MHTHTLHSVTAKQMLAELYFSMDSLTLAQEALDSIAVKDTSDEAADFISLMDIFIDLRQADTSLNGLDSAQLVTVTKIAEGHTAMAPSAEAVLYALNGEHVHHPIYKIEEAAGKRGWEREVAEPDLSQIMVYPNPTSGETTFILPEVTPPSTSIIFYALHGQKVWEVQIPPEVRTFQVSLVLPAGLYFFKISHSGTILHSGKLVHIK